ncbi:MAG: hypothetical protein ABIP03_10185 [Aquihabitans sp.]
MSDGEVRRVVGVYDADGTILGELSYFFRARLGRAHCSLCDITHGPMRERPEWRDVKSQLPVPFETFHRNDQPDAVRVLLDGVYPAIVAETEAGWVRLLDPEELAACDKSPVHLVSALDAAVAEQGLHLGPESS